MTSLLIFGPPDNASHIARALNSRTADVHATFIQPRGYLGLMVRTARSERAVIMRVGYRVGATTARGRLFDAYWSLLRRWLPNAAACHYWVGTDVLDTIKEARAGTIRWGALSAARDDLHLSVAPWLTSELESVGLYAVTALLPAPQQAPLAAPPLPFDFSVLTYLPVARFEFYGGPTILDAARRMPSVRFDVVGGPSERSRSATANVHWHGWVDDMTQLYAQTTVVVRIPQHDGFGNTVIEGLLNARHVIYTQEVPFVRRVWPATAEALVAALREFQNAHAERRLAPNLAGRAYALEQFDEERLVQNLLALVRAQVSATRASDMGSTSNL
jgi:glycosyltransferase involved in cell wall biosynthesis